MEMEKMMACLLVEIRTNRAENTSRLEENPVNLKSEMKAMQDKKDVNQEKLDKMDSKQEEMKAQMASLASKIDVNQERMESTVNVAQEKMEAWIAEMKDGRKEIMACQETTEACLECKEPTSQKMNFGAEHQEVPKEHAGVKNSGAMKKWQEDKHVAVGRLRKPKELTRGNYGSREEIGRRRQKDDPPFMSGKAYGKRQEKSDQRQGRRSNFEKTDVREGASAETGT
jgi:chromosome segregation ATPase